MRLLLVSFCLLYSSISSCLEEVGVYGSVVDARPFYEELIVPKVSGQSRVPSLNEERLINLATRNEQYDSGLTSGKVVSRKLNANEGKFFVASMCIVSNDGFSRAWLRKNYQIIKDNVALCYLSKANSLSDARELSADFPGVRFYGINPKFLIDRFGLVNYPVLISKRGIEQ